MNEIKIIKVNASKRYKVLIGEGLIQRAGELVKAVVSPCKIAIITDDVVDGLYANTLENALSSEGYSVVKFVIKNGEESKNLLVYGQILSFLASEQLTRTDAVVALGGGVVGDMAGFASATYLRGIKYVQIPTTLLAQVDSSVGGKTAIDLKEGKNLVGAFCQPNLVICDTSTLKTLPEKIYKDGMGEVVKYAILDKTVFSLVTKGEYDICDLVYASIDYKRKVVEIDEFESGMRKLLNFGHTPAHGIEKLSGYTISHGNAVAMGIKIILENSLRHNLLTADDYQSAISVLNGCVGEVADCPYPVKEVMEMALFDKKRSGEEISIMMAFGIGDVRQVKIKISELGEYIV